ncbi:DUF4112 domain-containing protein [Adhaeretor mobilis]|uniref:DUF4112 domain-containing protein n=1 Tax=Adhaeretor mobilis TaxID=1930276 RepID=A0A517MX84_9BACT|nr:DUF4112 domain-containing protein [Adhaeretor mobilis]QDS99492.1 hypothetical protein HG15A2_28150 [Adhaeretor mobilis]
MSSATIEQMPAESPLALTASDHRARLKRIQRVAHAMDSVFRIPGSQRHIGIDSLVGLVPGVGDIATAAASAYLVWEAKKLGVPKRTMLRMVWNIAVDSAIGVVPLLGDLFDMAYKANLHNAALIQKHVSGSDQAPDDSQAHIECLP